MQELIDELTLLLLYLTAFEENTVLDETTLRSWKGYPFDTLNKLSNNNLIFFSNRAKSVYLTEDGIELRKVIHAVKPMLNAIGINQEELFDESCFIEQQFEKYFQNATQLCNIIDEAYYELKSVYENEFATQK